MGQVGEGGKPQSSPGVIFGLGLGIFNVSQYYPQWEDSEMLYLLQQMFVDLKLVESFYIEVSLPSDSPFK